MKHLILLIFSLLSFLNKSQAQTWNSNYWTPVAYFIPCDSSLAFFTSDSSNLWQEGFTSTKAFFGLTGNEDAIMTDSVNTYAPSNHSYFDLMLPFDSYNYSCPNVEVRFLHKIESDAAKDGGYITWSLDGSSWYSMFETGYNGFPNIAYQNLYFPNDTLASSNEYAGFTGLIDTFLETRLQFIRYLPVRMASEQRTEGYPDTIRVRFHFVSDDVQTGKAGWIIKDLQVIGLDLGSYVSSINATSPSIAVSPNPSESGDFDFTVNGNADINQVQVFNVTGQLIYFSSPIQSSNLKVQLRTSPDAIYFYSLTLTDGTLFKGKLLR
jgi:hypothetical protein